MARKKVNPFAKTCKKYPMIICNRIRLPVGQAGSDLPILPGRHARRLVKFPHIVAVVGESDQLEGFLDGMIGIQQQLLQVLQLHLKMITMEGEPRFFPE